VNADTEIKVPKATSFFSEARLVEVVARTDKNRPRPVKICVHGKHSDVTMCGLEYRRFLNCRSFSFAPFGLYVHPPMTGDLRECVRDVVGQLKSFRTISFEWNVRYDKNELAEQLKMCGIPYSQPTTHVLRLDGNYETVFAGYNGKMGYEIRRARRHGVVVRRVQDEDAVNAFYHIHQIHAQRKGIRIPGLDRFKELLRLKKDVIFLAAELRNTILAGGWFFRDGDVLHFWQCSMDRAYLKSYPMHAILDYAIQLGCNEKFSTLDLGVSLGIPSLEHFKSSWGAVPVKVWHFSWRNPLWQCLHRIKHLLRS